jgi:uncharacterized protein YndB with AHSA1/START domain
MKKKSLQVKTQLEIAKPVHQVFEAIIDPKKMSHYFISWSLCDFFFEIDG